VGLGLQVLCYGLSLRRDWLELLGRENQGLIRRDLTEAMLSARSPFIPRVGWIVDIGAHLGLSEPTVLWTVWTVLMFAALLVVIGLFCRISSAVVWLLYLCTAKSAELLSYGVDNFTIIGLFYLTIAPLPDSMALDARRRGILPGNTTLQGLHRRVLQFHMCIIYFFGGLTKCLGNGWWDGSNIWRALIRPPSNIIDPEILIRWKDLFPIAGVFICLLETGYPFFIWGKRTRTIWFTCICAMHLAIGLTLGMYLFAFIMIVLNAAAFGAGLVSRGRTESQRKHGTGIIDRRAA